MVKKQENIWSNGNGYGNWLPESNLSFFCFEKTFSEIENMDDLDGNS